MRPILRADGTLLVPMRAEAEDGTIGDGMVPLAPGEPGYAQALAEARPEGVDPIAHELARPPGPPEDELDR